MPNDSQQTFHWATHIKVCQYLFASLVEASDVPGLVSCCCFDSLGFEVLPLL